MAGGQQAQDGTELIRVKSFIREEYLVKDCTAEDMIELLVSVKGITTTERKLKLKLTEWGWLKKLQQSHYSAMYRMIKEYGRDVKFSRPVKGGTERALVTGRKAEKEWQRKRANKEKKGEPAPRVIELQEARDFLEKSDIITVFPNERAQRFIHFHTEVDSSGDSDDESVTSGELTDELNVVASSSRELNMRNFPERPQMIYSLQPPTTVATTNARRMTEVLPHQVAFFADLHSNINPQKPGYQLAGPIVDVINHHERDHYITPLTIAFEACDFTDSFNFHLDRSLFNPQVSVREKLIADTLAEHYNVHDRDGRRVEALEFSAYYIAQTLAGHATLDEYYHVDRQKSRSKLRAMLSQDNMELLTHLYWVSSVIMSYDQKILLFGFLADCVDCIEVTNSFIASILKPWIRLMIFNHREILQTWHPESPRLSRPALDALAETFDASQELHRSISILEQHGKAGSATWLILWFYIAWSDMCRDVTEGLRKLLYCLQRAESIFGKKHLITINCSILVARGREVSGQLDLALQQLRITMCDMRPCSRMLKPTYYEVMLKLARVIRAQRSAHSKESLQEARILLEHVFESRLQTMGARAEVTWQAATELFDTIREQGFPEEAERREHELRELHDAIWRTGR